VGASTYISSLTKIVHAEDADRFEEIAYSLKANEEKRFVFRMLSGGEYKNFYAKLKRTEDSVTCFEIELFDIEEVCRTVEEYADTITKQRALLVSDETIYFEYNFKTKKIKLSQISPTRAVVKAETELSQWKEEYLQTNVISDEDIHAFHRLCFDIENGKNVHAAFTVGEEKDEFLVIDGKTITKDCEKYCTCGTITSCKKTQLPEEEKSDNSLDELTGLYRKNRIRKLAEEGINNGGSELASLVIIDIDDFKHINDSYGHLFGDEVIATIAEIIKDAVGEDGVVGRFGGDEFFILVDRVKNKDELRSILRTIKTNVYARRWKNQPSAIASCSIGSATYPVNGKDYDTIFKKADKALYIAKEKGKNRYVIYEEAIHGELKTESTADKFGLITNLGTGSSETAKFINYMTSELMSKGEKAIPTVMEALQKRFFIDRINIYYGEDFEKKAHLGEYKRSEVKSYIDDDYIKLFDESNILVMNFIYKLEATHEAAFKRLSNENVYSAVQCIIGSKEDVRGICSFELINYKKMFAHDEIMIYSMFTNMVGMILDAK
jgi:diguanylate cyclase (GGDEF)-like protein